MTPALSWCRGRGDWRSQEGSQLCVGLLQVLVEDTDQLWHNHCLRDFKNEKPEEFESWREMYLRLHDAREQRLLMLARNIGSAHANKPKGGAEGRGLGLKPVQFRSCLALCACLCFVVQWYLAFKPQVLRHSNVLQQGCVGLQRHLLFHVAAPKPGRGKHSWFLDEHNENC